MSPRYLGKHEPKNYLFLLKQRIGLLLYQQTRKHVQIITWLQLNHALLLVRYLSNSVNLVKCYVIKHAVGAIFFSATQLRFSRFCVSPCREETIVKWGGEANHRSIAYFLSNISAKNYQNRLMQVEVVVCNISVVFLRHSVCTCMTL